MATVHTLPQRRAVAFVAQHDFLCTWDLLVRWADGRVTREAGDFARQVEALEAGAVMAVTIGWAFEPSGRWETRAHG